MTPDRDRGRGPRVRAPAPTPVRGSCFVPGVLPALALAGILLLPGAAEAQIGIRLLPQVGAYAPLSELGEVRDGGGSVLEAGRRSSSLAVGLGLELGDPRRAISFRGQLGYATSSSLSLRGRACPPCEARGTLLTATAAAVIRPLPPLPLVEPYLILGGGVKRYGFEPRDLEEESWRELLRNQTRPAGQVGAGVEVSLVGIPTRWELNTFLSRFEGGEAPEGPGSRLETDFQTDLFLTLSIPLGG